MNIKSMVSLLGVELLIFFSLDMFLSGFPIYITNMGISEDRMGVLFGVFMLAGMTFRPILARVGQRSGHKLVLAVAALAAFASPWLYLLADSFAAILVVRVFHGIVPASFITSSQMLLIRAAGEDHKAVGLGLFGIMGGISLLFVPYLGVHVLYHYGRIPWLLTASVCGALAVFIFWFQVRTQAADVETSPYRPTALNVRLIAVPLVCNVLLALGIGSVLTYVTTYALAVGYTNPGQFFTVMALTNIGIKIAYCLFGDRLPQKSLMLAGTCIFAVGLLLLAYPPTPAWVILSAIPIGVGFFTTTAMMMLNVTNAVPGIQRSMAAALMANSIDLGLATAAIGLGILVTTWSYQTLYSFTLACALIALLIMSLRLEERPLPRDMAPAAAATESGG